MYQSNSYCVSNNNNNDNLISSFYTLDQTLPDKPSVCEINPNYEQETPLPYFSYYNIPSPFSHYENDDAFMQYDLYLQRQTQIAEVSAPDPVAAEMVEHSDNIKEMRGECCSKKNESVVIDEIPRTRPSEKERHSKIETAQGLRDRRMRLSLQVARDFFHLQDILGHNKSSKTIEWLLSKSKAAIKDLTSESLSSLSSTSECEVVSKNKGKNSGSPSKETKSTRGLTRKSVFSPLTKESREKARERARERTREKTKRDGSKSGLENTTSHQTNPVGSWCEDNFRYQLQLLDEVAELSSSLNVDYDMHKTGVPQEHRFKDFNLYGRSRDAYNSSNPR